MKKNFYELLEDGIVILDGATGTNLQMRGMSGGVCPEQWMIEHKEILMDLQREYIEAGSHIVYAPTFSANAIKLREYGLQAQVAELNRTLVEISKTAAGDKALVAGDMTMTGQQLKPLGTLSLDTLINCYAQQAQAIAEAGADLFVVETMMSLPETRAAILGIRQVSELPIMVTMTFEAGGRTLYGTDPVTALITLQEMGIDAFGINCSSGPENMQEMVETMGAYAKIPLIVKANAGLPQLVDGKTIFPMEPGEFAEKTLELVQMGARIAGGCCGTTPEHIRALATECGKAFAKTDLCESKGFLRKTEDVKEVLAVTTERRTWFLDKPLAYMQMNTLLHAGKNKEFCEALAQMDWDILYDLMEELEEDEPELMEIYVDGLDVDGAAVMKELFNILDMNIAPICVSASHLKTLEAALIHYPGRLLVRDIFQSPEDKLAAQALAKKYGALMKEF